jgi:ABC-2 type transport system ATP-binding protein
MSVVSVRELRKEYGALVAVDGVSFDIVEGEVYALLGENGAGKSTTVEILEGHRTRTSGDVTVLGADPGKPTRDFRNQIGIVLQASGVEHELTVREAMTIYGASYRDHRPVGEVIELVGLTPQLDQRVGTLSGGQRRRLDLALGIIGRPSLLFLDEPTTGFDPAARRQAWELVRELGSGGTTVLLTTHYLDEAEQLADRVGVLAAGRMVAEGTPEELTGSGTTIVRFDVPPGTTAGDLAAVLPAGATVGPDRIEFATTTPTSAVHAVTGWAMERGIEIPGLVVTRPSLEDVFLQLAAQQDAAPR